MYSHGDPIDFFVVHVSRAGNSSRKGKKGLQTLVKKYLNSIKITTLTTEGHVQIRSFLRKEYPEILHQFDVWHFPKSVKKALSEIARKRDCHQAILSIKAIINRLSWCCASLIGNEKFIMEKWLSMWNHIRVFTLGKIINYFTNVNTDNWTTRRIKSPYSELIWSAFFPDFPAFRLNTDFVFSPNEGKSGKNADQKNSEYGLF